MFIKSENLSILRLPDVKALTKLSGSQIYALTAKGLFPSPIKLGSTRASGWVSTAVQSWIRDQIIASQKESGAK